MKKLLTNVRIFQSLEPNEGSQHGSKCILGRTKMKRPSKHEKSDGAGQTSFTPLARGEESATLCEHEQSMQPDGKS